MKFRKFSNGFTLIELMVVIVIIGIAAIAASAKLLQYALKLQSQQAADNISVVGKAVSTYINQNPSVVSVTPYTDVTFAQLIAAQVISSNFSPAPPWGGAYQIRVQRIGSSPPYRYEALVYSTTAWAINGTLRRDLLGEAAIKIGGPGGVSYDASGPVGSVPVKGGPPLWAHPVTSFTPFAGSYLATGGQLFYNVAYANSGNDAQYLRVDGNNSMTGNLNVGTNSINNANNITATGAVNAGTVVSAGAITAATGNIVATAGQVNAGTTITAGTGITSTAGNIVATAGQVNAGTTITAGTGITSTTGDIAATAGQVNAGTTITAGTGITSTTGDIRATAGSVRANVDVNIDSLLTRPSPPNTTSLKSLVPTLVEVNSFTVSGHGQSIPVPVCSTGGAARVFIFQQMARGQVQAGNWGADVRAIGPLGGPWTVNALDSQNNPLPNFTGLARTFCAY